MRLLDLRSVREFANANGHSIDVEAIGELCLSGNHPYVEKPVVPIVPEVSTQCRTCGRCARECPTQAIEDSFCANSIKSISCMHCVFICPEKARYIPKEKYEAIVSKLDAYKSHKKENEYYIVRT